MNNGLELAGNHEKLVQINLHDILLKWTLRLVEPMREI